MDGAEYPIDKIQIITIEDLFNGKQPQLPAAADNQTFKKHKRKKVKPAVTGCLIRLTYCKKNSGANRKRLKHPFNSTYNHILL